jgi:hypothetical protein
MKKKQDCVEDYQEDSEDDEHIFAIMNFLLQCIPRDADYDSQLWTTVDTDSDNMRKKMISKMVQGFGLYLVLTGKNFIYEAKTEARYRDLLIVCNVQASSGPLDMEGLLYSINGIGSRLGVTDASDAPTGKRKLSMEDAEDGMEGGMFRRGVVRSNANPKCKNKVGKFYFIFLPKFFGRQILFYIFTKLFIDEMVLQGPRPSDKDQKQWAPLMYFVHSVAGTVIAMMNKMGTFKLLINYGVKSVSDYLFNYVTSTLGCFIDTGDENNASRYYESYQCRMVAETVLRSTFMSMAICEDLDTAITHAINSLTYNAVHLSLLPVLQERLIQRLIQYEPLLAMSTLGICLDAPVVSMKSILQVHIILLFLNSPPYFFFTAPQRAECGG